MPTPQSLATPLHPPGKPGTPLVPSNIPLFTPGITSVSQNAGSLLKRPVYAPDPYMSTSAVKFAPPGAPGGLGTPGGIGTPGGVFLPTNSHLLTPGILIVE